MKNKIQALACAAILALGGFNAWTALSGSQETEELQLGGMEALGFGEGAGPDGKYYTWWSTSSFKKEAPNGDLLQKSVVKNCDGVNSSFVCNYGEQCDIYHYHYKVGEMEGHNPCPSWAR